MRIREVVISAALAVSGFAQPPETCDFRQASWGMSKAQVLAAETKAPSEIRETNGELIVRYDSIQMDGFEGSVVYIFAKDKLVRAKYLLDAKHEELNDFIADYQVVDPLLRTAFGEPTWQQAVWEDDSTQEEKKGYLDQDRALAESILPSDHLVGLAVSLGHLKLYTELGEGRTKVVHALTGADGHISHQVEFHSVELAALEDEVLHRDSKP